MRRSVLISLGAAALALGTAACGGGGNRYEETGLHITFAIPSGFRIAHDINFNRTAGPAPVDRAAIALKVKCTTKPAPAQGCLNPDNLITISRYNLKSTITSANLSKVKGEVDKVIGSLAGKPVSGREVDYGGLPGYEYVISLTQPINGVSRMSVLFDGATEYLVNCQSTPEKRDKIEKNCRTVLDSIKRV
jgi:hypothetical protein